MNVEVLETGHGAARPWGASRPLPRPATPSGLQSFWMGGFESACQINTVGKRIDMLSATQHDRFCVQDYAMLADLGITTVRDGLRWPMMDQRGKYDFGSFVPMVRAARQTKTQVIWNICHYGWPDDVDISSPAFVDRFAKFCSAVAKCVTDHSDAVPWFCPINEISFLSWAIGHKGIIFPYRFGQAHEVKKQLVRAAIAGCEAIWDVDSRARFVHIDPIIHVVCPRDQPEVAAAAQAQHEAQFSAWDMLSGRAEPQLGGAQKYLDVLGVNYYHSNQFEHPDVRLRWEDEPRDERFLPFYELLNRAQKRYNRPVIIAETSHFGAGRARWIREMGDQIALALAANIPLLGTCIYPIIDRPDWEDTNLWHNSGLYDIIPDADGNLTRVLHQEYANAFRDAQRRVAAVHGMRDAFRVA